MKKKKILITGKGSYVGTNFIKWLKQWPDQYDISEISVRGNEWKRANFGNYDTVIHVAGIAHVSADPKLEERYYKVNRDLTIEVAEFAKEQGTKQFIFMSSIIVYGDGDDVKRVINKDTLPNPSNFYGNSKLQAEEGLKPLEDQNFKISVIRPPMIYGKNSKGNYPKLSKIAKLLPIFPEYENQRSMLHVDNLSEFIKKLIDNNESGLFFPQNAEYVKTSDLVKEISTVHNKKIFMVKTFNPLIKVLIKRINIINKVFGNLVYDQNISVYKENYRVRDLSESVRVTEK
ncbi:NAD-dependent epimerase/dehydratase family protein [Planococcus plakortidis]|uniref:NAD-dependent epimerase/dehydratase family protein n=1 Tax=Planococcus plakortidis TaxID=1038856 RepID=UPI00385D6D91